MDFLTPSLFAEVPPCIDAFPPIGWTRKSVVIESFSKVIKCFTFYFDDGGVWGSLGGIIDADQDTYIKAESSANADEDELLFVTNGSEKMIIKDDGKVGIGTITPSSLLSLSGDDTTIKIQDSKNDDTGSTNIELINGPVNSFDDNTNLYNWRISNSNNQYILASGSNNQIYERFVISGETGNVGLGTQPHIFTEGENDEYKMTVKGSINVDGFIYKNGEIYRGEGSVGVISQNMPIQTQSITYTKTRIMTSTESNSQNIVPSTEDKDDSPNCPNLAPFLHGNYRFPIMELKK